MGAFQPVMGLYPILPHPCYVPARPVVRSVKVVWPGGRKPVPNHPPPPESLCLQTLYLAPPPPRPVGRDAPFPSPGKTHPSGLGATSLAQIICSGAGRGHREGASAHLGEGGWEDTQQVATSCPHGLGASRGRPSVFGPEHARRLEIFAQNLAQAQRLQEEDLGTAKFGVTAFSDLTGTGTPPGS